jgi:hypothetical protein
MLGQLQSEELIKIARRRITITNLDQLILEVSEPSTRFNDRISQTVVPETAANGHFPRLVTP